MKKKQVIILTRYHSEAASSRYRSYNYLPYFNEAGIEPIFSPMFYDGYVKDLYGGKKHPLKIILSYLKRVGVLLKFCFHDTFYIIEKELFPGIPAIFEKPFLYKKSYSVDFDDATFLRNINKPLLRHKHLQFTNQARFVTVGNHWYFDKLPDANCRYLPTVIDFSKYTHVSDSANEIPVICWIGTPVNLKYLQAILPVLGSMHQKGVHFLLRIIGTQNIDTPCLSDFVAWNSDDEQKQIASCDIGIMPLEQDEWAQGKCGFKLIQYMACGLPVVASKVAANNEIVAQGENGFIASDAKAWEEYLTFLCTHPEMRRSMGRRGRITVRERYSYQRWGTEYARFIDAELQ